MIFCALGVALCANAGFGVSMIEAPVYVTYLKLSQISTWFTYGKCEYILQAIGLMLMCLIIRQFKWQYLLSFAAAVIFGFILDGWRLLVGNAVYSILSLRIVSWIAGTLITTFAVACFFRTELPLQIWELIVKEISDVFHKDITRVKWIYDFTSLAVGIILMFIFFQGFNWQAIGIGTIITTLINAPLIGLFGKLIDRIYPKKN